MMDRNEMGSGGRRNYKTAIRLVLLATALSVAAAPAARSWTRVGKVDDDVTKSSPPGDNTKAPFSRTSQRKIVRDNKGIWWVVFTKVYSGWTSVMLSHSSDGVTWETDYLFSGNAGQIVAAPAMKQWDYPSIDINSERDTIHVVVHNKTDNQIYYTHCVNMNNFFSSTSWKKANDTSSGADRVDTAGTVDANTAPVIAIDSLGKPHIAYDSNETTRREVYYRTHRNGSWSTPYVVSASNMANTAPMDPSIDVGHGDTVYILYREDDNPGTGASQDSFYLAEIDPPYTSVTSRNRRLFDDASATAEGGSVAAQDHSDEVWVVGGFWRSALSYVGLFNYYDGSSWSDTDVGSAYESSAAPDHRVYRPMVGTNTASGSTDHKIVGEMTYDPWNILHHTWNGSTFDNVTVTGDGGSIADDDRHFSLEKHKPYWKDDLVYCWYDTSLDEIHCNTVAMTQECVRAFNYFDTPLDVTPTQTSDPGNQSDWIPVDVSSAVPIVATGVLLQVVNESSTNDYIYGVRREDTTRCWMISSDSICNLSPSYRTAKRSTQRFLVAPLDYYRVFEMFNESTNVKTKLIGYTGPSVRYFDPTSNKTLTSGSWQDLDINADTGSNTAIGAIITVMNTFGTPQSYALRKKGSTDQFLYQLDNNAASVHFVGVDAGEVLQAYVDLGIKIWLSGYIMDGAVFFTDAKDVSAGSTGSYVTSYISPHIGSDDANGAFLEIVNTDNAAHQTALRQKGAAYDFYKDMYHQGAVTAVNGNHDLEQKIASTNQDMKLIGYSLDTCGDAGDCNAAYWWNCAWENRRTLFMMNAGREVLSDFPALVCLDSSKIDYAKVQSQGQDLRFVDADNQTVLSHEIEEWNPNGTSWVWVKIPQVDASDTDSILMYYGNPRAGDAQNPTDVWSNGYDSVYHFHDGFSDASGNRADATNNGTTETTTNKLAGNHRSFDGAGDYINLGWTPDYAASQNFTWEAWIRLEGIGAGNSDTILGIEDTFGGGGDTSEIGLRVSDSGADGEADELDITLGDDVGSWSSTGIFPAGLDDGTWRYVAIKREGSMGTVYHFSSYLEGNIGAGTSTMNFPTRVPWSTTVTLLVGAQWNTDGGDGSLENLFKGGIDEVRTSTVARSRDWLEAQYSCMTCSFLTFTDEMVATSVELVSFTARGVDRGVELEWETGSEMENLGFNLYRSVEERGSYVKVTPTPVAGLGSSPAGVKYFYRDGGLTNGVTYFYRLEDVETTGKTKLHGPVWATPQSDSMGEEGAGGSTDEPLDSRMTVGDPSSNELRVVEEGVDEVVLELETGGFYAEPQEDGTVRLEIPGYEESSEVGYPSLPLRRSWVDAIAGRRVELVSVKSYGEESFEGLRPWSGSPSVEVSPRGSVRAGMKRQARTVSRVVGIYPDGWARLVSVGYQGDVKKALVEMAPLRWDEGGRRLVLSHRLVVRLKFTGRDVSDRVRDGWRGRRYRKRASEEKRQVVARFVTKEKGLYGVGFEEVFGGRSSRGVRAELYRLSRQGDSVPFHIVPAGVFGPGSVLYFIGEGAEANPFGNEAVYELEVGVSGPVMPVRSASATGALMERYWATVEKEEDLLYQSTLVEAPDMWLWSMLFAPVKKAFEFEANDLAETGETSKLGVWLQGASDFGVEPDHHVRLSVNGTWVGETSWSGKKVREVHVELGAGVLREGTNTLEIENVGDTDARYSMVILDRFEVVYPRSARAVEGRLEGLWSESGTAEVSGLGAGVVVVKLEERGPVWIEGVKETSEGIRFGVEEGGVYLAAGRDAVLEVSEVRKPVTSGLKSTQDGADYIVLGPGAFLGAAAPLVELRASQGLRAQAVSLEEVFSEFGFGEEAPQAIQDFLSYAYHNWAVSPRYVVLLGDGTFDFKDRLGTGVANRVPPYPILTSYLETASDPLYGAVNGDDLLPDLAIGRLPAATVEELVRMVGKILAWEASGRTLRGRAVMVTDNPDLAGNFEADAEDLARTVLGTQELKRIYLSQLGASVTRSEIRRAFDEGASLVNYIGHGAIHLWADENILNIEDVATMSPQGEQPLLLTMNCLNGYFTFPYFDSLAEALLKAEDKGVVAAFSPSGLSLNVPAHVLHRLLLREILEGGHATLGDAVLAAQAAYAEAGAFPELLTIYHLFGDPALRIQ